MKFEIAKDDLSDGAIVELLDSHLQEMQKYSPAESIHALDSQKLKDPSITFWAARVDGVLAGCGALKALTPSTGEIKSMKTNAAYLRNGIARGILEQIILEAKERSYSDLFLETGSNDAFTPAIEMYKQSGFVECGPFGDYQLDPFSVFYAKTM